MKQNFHLVLGDIAFAAAVRTVCGSDVPPVGADYTAGSIREHWLAGAPEGEVRRRVLALASAGASSLSTLPAEALLVTAQRYGVPLDPTIAEQAAAYFSAKRDAILTYDR